jgi:hypothetical protein
LPLLREHLPVPEGWEELDFYMCLANDGQLATTGGTSSCVAAEPVSARTLGAAAVIVVAVVMITSERPRATAPRPVPEPARAR